MWHIHCSLIDVLLVMPSSIFNTPWRDFIQSRQKLLYLFGLLLAFQWTVFMVMVVAEMSQAPSSGVRSLRTEDTIAWNRTLASTCFSSFCLEQVALGLSRVYPNRTDQNFCIASGRTKDAQNKWQGLILVKGKSRTVIFGSSRWMIIYLTHSSSVLFVCILC